ncbi:MAG TPA: hypothetical protein VJZ91_14360 [Blastocatellia bacterium]|nr:hypothetical protein [Blastocatellia bacterium]
MKRYLIGLALTGLGRRLARRASGIVPGRRRNSLPANVAGMLIAAGVGAGLARLLNKKP